MCILFCQVKRYSFSLFTCEKKFCFFLRYIDICHILSWSVIYGDNSSCLLMYRFVSRIKIPVTLLAFQIGVKTWYSPEFIQYSVSSSTSHLYDKLLCKKTPIDKLNKNQRCTSGKIRRAQDSSVIDFHSTSSLLRQFGLMGHGTLTTLRQQQFQPQSLGPNLLEILLPLQNPSWINLGHSSAPGPLYYFIPGMFWANSECILHVPIIRYPLAVLIVATDILHFQLLLLAMLK